MERSTWNIYEEARILKKSIIDSVFEPMGHCRPTPYLLKKEYQTKRWLEKSRSTYITSARFKYEWFWKTFKNVVTQYYVSEHEVYTPFGEDIFAAIADGARTWADYRKNKKNMSELDFSMEIMNTMIGEAEDAFFGYQQFKDNQILKECFRPPNSMQLYLKEDVGNRPKEEFEVRIVGIDYAFANTTGVEKNDNTIIECISGIWKGNRFERHLDYIEGFPASDTLGAANRARELFHLYQADYLVPDNRSGGEVLYNTMTMPWDRNERGSVWDLRGLTVSNKIEYQVVPENKLQDLRERTVDPNAIPCIIPFIGTAELNGLAWVELKKQMETNNFKFLVSCQDRQTLLEDNGKYFEMTSEDLVKDTLPFLQTDALIQEAVNLKAEFKNDRIKLSEPRSGTKDRVVVLAYINYIFSLIENNWNRQANQEEVDWEDIQLIF